MKENLKPCVYKLWNIFISVSYTHLDVYKRQIREIRDEVAYSPTEGKYKVYIIDEVHMLSIGAFNALLKTLEEPPSYVIFILATTEAHKIPITILSRCQRYDFRRITVETIADRLRELTEKEQVEVEDKAPVSYTHLDVYKRQSWSFPFNWN